MNVCILGSSGLLGSTLHRYIDSQSDMSISEPTRDMISSVLHDSRLMDTMTREFDVVVNCVGIVKPKMKDIPRELVYDINVTLPNALANSCYRNNTRLIHICSDCVFTGDSAPYDENYQSDATDLYALTKKLHPTNCCTIRTSFIGSHSTRKYGLLEWVKSKRGESISGYVNCVWNGVTCLQLSEYIYDIIYTNKHWTGARHYFSPNSVTKYDLCKSINDIYDLGCDITPYTADVIEGTEIQGTLDRSLSTVYTDTLLPVMSIHDQIQTQKDWEL